ncbi:MAG: hypothetical protein CSB21_03795 [Deltaproteobacteria bacterium]|nr:MAG: hypothetical protein CSB21_03795 [Deltaproteobacteria bacterium]
MKFIPKTIEDGEYILNGITVEVLHLIHKKYSFQEIKKYTSLKDNEINEALKYLIQNGLIEQVSSAGNFLGKDFKNSLTTNLAHAIGPLANFLVDDAFNNLEIKTHKITKNQAATLIRTLSEEITDKSVKLEYIKKMSVFLK